MKNSEIFNAYLPLVRLSKMKFTNYEKSISLALLLREIREKYEIIFSLASEINEEFVVSDGNGNFITKKGLPVIRQGKDMAEYQREMKLLSDTDTEIHSRKIILSEKDFKDEIPSPEDILAVSSFVSFEGVDEN